MPTDLTDLHRRIAEACGGELGKHDPSVLNLWNGSGVQWGVIISTLDGLHALWDAECKSKGWDWERSQQYVEEVNKAVMEWSATGKVDGRLVGVFVIDTGDHRADFTRLLAEVLEAMKGGG